MCQPTGCRLIELILLFIFRSSSSFISSSSSCFLIFFSFDVTKYLWWNCRIFFGHLSHVLLHYHKSQYVRCKPIYAFSLVCKLVVTRYGCCWWWFWKISLIHFSMFETAFFVVFFFFFFFKKKTCNAEIMMRM